MKVKKETQFTQIIDKNKALIQSICRHHNPNTEDQKDMYQEIVINIWKSLDNFRGDSKISTWIYRVAVNTSLNFNSKSYRNMRLMVYEDERYLNALIDEAELSLKYRLENHLEQLQIELNLLSVIDKALITLLLEGLSTREIADIIGLTEPNIRVKIHRIKLQLKKKLGQCNTINHQQFESITSSQKS